MPVLLRPATPGDAADISRLVLLSAERFLPAVFGPRIEGGLARLGAQEGTLFSWAHTMIAEAEGRTAGMLLGYSEREIAREDPATGLGLLHVLGGDMVRRFGRLLRVRRMIRDIAADEWYVSNIAVLPAVRGRGVGRTLMRDAEKRARASGAAAIVLDVETDHPAAISFYTGLGFQTVSATPSFSLGGHPFAFLRMRKPLSA